ncbi:MAG TPA: hypothetical protein VK395_30710 [Gemmataceae bacterium]|nr:hypothetical protein [Gemmataceae bacterium]
MGELYGIGLAVGGTCWLAAALIDGSHFELDLACALIMCAAALWFISRGFMRTPPA